MGVVLCGIYGVCVVVVVHYSQCMEQQPMRYIVPREKSCRRRCTAPETSIIELREMPEHPYRLEGGSRTSRYSETRRRRVREEVQAEVGEEEERKKEERGEKSRLELVFSKGPEPKGLLGLPGRRTNGASCGAGTCTQGRGRQGQYR